MYLKQRNKIVSSFLEELCVLFKHARIKYFIISQGLFILG